ncbi:Peroxidase [Thalictrum thalictroides]|uniref:Peroxidase n=1 Tax=Thalictrum thalictroides TaxID=46969 RepID=A0A7J6X572_THATH|nr:Peroxidase [Thalictrum thalictroides]
MALLFFSSSLSIAHPGFNFNWGAFGGNGGRAGFGGNGGQGAYGGNGGQGALGGNGGQGVIGGNGGQGAFGGNGGQGAIGGNGGQGAIGGNGGQGAAGGNGGQVAFGGTGGRFVGLFPEFYQYSCPQANDIVMSVLQKAIANEPRMAASLLRLHFHDCFSQGCDASVLLDDTTTIRSEKQSGPNKNSLRGFDVIDEIKAKLEEACPEVVSCADILALAARGSTVLSGGPNWELPLGRRDSKTASLSGSNKNIPAPNSTLQNLITFFNRQGLNEVDLVALSGSHTIGVARCVTFRQRLYNQNGNNQPDETLERNYYNGLKTVCPKSGGDNIISPLDLASPVKFDNTYFKLLLWGRGLLNSDEVLLTGKGGKTTELVKQYAGDEGIFFQQFAQSMVKMGNISPLTGYNGEVRKNCRRIN